MSQTNRILIIDDEPIVIKSCQRVLKKFGFSIESANSGDEGLAKVAESKYDLIITDLKMPGISGMEVLKRIKEKNPEQEVIVFTGFANVGTARESLKLGAFDYIPKPFTPDELRIVVTNALEHVKDKSKTKGLDLMAIVAHEFKSPLATVQTTADTFYGGYFGKVSPEQKKVLETIMRNCQYLEDTIRCYIDLSRMELDDLESFMKRTNFLDEIVKPIVQTPEYQTNLKRMRLVTEFQDVPDVMCDANLIKIVVNNLVNNAIKYGYPETEIKIRVYREGEEIVFSIYGEGVGIAPEDIESRLFKKFSRLKQKGTEGVKGSGLGLYICKIIMEKHNGRIIVRSEVGKFSEFRVYLNQP